MCIITANDRNTTSHELSKVVPHRSQSPKFGGIKMRVVLGHGHGPCADVTGNVDLSLGHGIGHAIGGMPMEDDFCTRIEPTHIIGGRPHDFDACIGKSHRSDTLSGRAVNFQINRLSSGSPQPASNAVLAVGLYFQEVVSFAHRLLNSLF